MQQMNADDGDTSRNVDMDEVKVVLRDELDKLPAKYRLPLILHYFGGLKPEEMARELGCKPSTLGVRLHRGRKLLADSLAERGVSIGGTLLGVALATLIRSSVQENLIQHTSFAATQYAAGNAMGAGVSAQVLGFNQLAKQGMLIAKIKSAVAAAAILAAAAAGAAEFVAKVKPFGFDMNLPGQVKSIFDPILRAFRQSVPTPIAQNTPAEQEASRTTTVSHEEGFAFDSHDIFPSSEGLGEQPTSLPAPRYTRPTSTDGGAGAGRVAVASLNENAIKNDARSAFTLTIPQPTVRWPASTATSSFAVASANNATNDAAEPAPSQSQSQSPAQYMSVGGAMSIGAAAGSSRSFVWSGPGTLSVRNLSVGGQGTGYFHQTGGEVDADKISLGESKGSKGTYLVTGNSKVNTGAVDVGGEGDGHLVIASTDASFHATDITVGKEHGSTGSIDLLDGKLTDNSVTVGGKGSGIVTQTGGVHDIKPSYGSTGNSGLVIARSTGSEGIYKLDHGDLNAPTEAVGTSDVGTFKQSGGTNGTRVLRIGVASTGNGAYKLNGGTLKFTRGGNKTGPGLVVGDLGVGGLGIGDADGSGTITETGAGPAVSAVVRETRQGSGRLYGWGSVRLRGNLDMNGATVAEGYGGEHDLNLSSFSGVRNTIDNEPGENHGWFARHGGRLVLPGFDITSPACTITWGEDHSDNQLDLINSARFTFNGVDNPIASSVSLLAADRSDVPTAPTGVQFASIWKGDFDAADAQSMSVTLRYDDTFSPGIAAGNVQLWTYDGTTWKPIVDGTSVDVTDRLISATLSPSDWLAVSTISGGGVFPQTPDATGIGSAPILTVLSPEPGTLGILALAAATLLPRRRSSRR
jgi:hypothetical protein